MNIEDIREYCIAKPAVTEELPFGPDTLVFKVGGKEFLLVGLDQVDSLSFNVKCDPDVAVELRLNYPETIIPGYHMNKKHWNTVYCNTQLPYVGLRTCIAGSYAEMCNVLSVAVRQSIAPPQWISHSMRPRGCFWTLQPPRRLRVWTNAFKEG